MQIECLWRGEDHVGESPLWHPIEHVLYWVDIFKPALHRLDVSNGAHQQWPMPDLIGAIAWREQGGLIAAMRTGIAFIDLPTGTVKMQADLLACRQDVRFNDAKCDRAGRFWAGTADMQGINPKGVLYRFDPEQSVHLMQEGFLISNGMGWSPDNAVMYHADSEGNKIFRYDFDIATGNIRNAKLLIEPTKEQGLPDGLTVDSEGYIWVAHWNGSRVTRYKPNGQVDFFLPFPVPLTTSCCFGGKDYRTLYVTSAAMTLSAQQLTQSPLSGSLFAVQVEVAGLPEAGFKG